MSDDQSSSGSKTWWERLSQAFSDDPQNKEDLLEILREAETDNIIDADALSLIEGAMLVTDMQAREIMIPRAQMSVLKADTPPVEYADEIISSAHSRYPVVGDSKDEIIGILLAKDLLSLALKNDLHQSKIQDILRPVWFIPESKRLNQLLKEFKDNRNHMAIVVDEYGGVAGLVTIEDVLEQIVGEIEDEHDFDDEGLIKCTEDNHFTVKAHTSIEEFNEYFNSTLDEDEFDTIGGLTLKHFGRLPKRGESISFGGFKIKVLNADSRQLRLLQINRQT